MNSYTDIDGVPVAAGPEPAHRPAARDVRLHRHRRRRLLRGRLPPDACTASPATDGEAARLGAGAGIDVELPTVALLRRAAGRGRAGRRRSTRSSSTAPLDAGAAPEVRARPARRGLVPEPAGLGATVDLDAAASRTLARELAERSVVLLANDGTLPLRRGRPGRARRPARRRRRAMLGCYSFPLHVGAHHPDVRVGHRDPDAARRAARRTGLRGHATPRAARCSAATTTGIAEAARRGGREADVCVAVLGDLAGLFGRGTSGEGCDVADLRLPGRQEELLEALLATGTPVVLVLLVGRPYDVSPAGRPARRGRVRRSSPARRAGRRWPSAAGPGEPVGAAAGELPRRRLEPARRRTSRRRWGSAARSAASTRRRCSPSATGCRTRSDLGVAAAVASGPAWADRRDVRGGGAVRNTGDRHGTEVVQVYLHDPVAEVARPVQQLVAAARVDLRGRRGAHGRVPAARRPDVVHRPRRGADRRAGTGRAAGGRLQPGHRVVRDAADIVGASGRSATTGPWSRPSAPDD